MVNPGVLQLLMEMETTKNGGGVEVDVHLVSIVKIWKLSLIILGPS